MSVLIFDFDGTITDGRAFIVETYNLLSPKYHLPKITPDDIPMIRKKGIPVFMKEHNVSMFTFLRIVRQFQKIMHEQIERVPPIAGMPEVLARLSKKHTLGIVTANNEKNVRLFLQIHNIEDTFLFIHSEKNILGKDRVLKKVVKQNHFDPNETWYIGDELHDAEAARKAGIHFLGVDWGVNDAESLRNAGADEVVGGVEELEKYFKQ
jgi:phosphoglycolate phosphatase